VLAGGQARCWGDNLYGQIGNGSTSSFALFPTPVLASAGAPLAGVEALALGTRHSCALASGGQVRCWGDNSAGQVGNGGGDIGAPPEPFAVAVLTSPDVPLAGVQSLSAGEGHTCVASTNGQARCWGFNLHSQLGTGDFGFSGPFAEPVLASFAGAPITGVQAVGAGASSSCALMNDGQARCWGDNLAGQLGASSDDPIADFPVTILASPGAPLTGLLEVDAGRHHAAALSSAGGQVIGWGHNSYGQLGNGTSLHRPHPVAVALP
jgi:alpha-tubulin suppressor-like RCC1 family protein